MNDLTLFCTTFKMLWQQRAILEATRWTSTLTKRKLRSGSFCSLCTVWQFVKACGPRSKPLGKSSRCASYTTSRYCAAKTQKFNVLPQNTKNNDVRRRMKLLAVVRWAPRYLRSRIPSLNCEASWIFTWKSLNRYGFIGFLLVLGNNNISGWGHFKQ